MIPIHLNEKTIKSLERREYGFNVIRCDLNDLLMFNMSIARGHIQKCSYFEKKFNFKKRGLVVKMGDKKVDYMDVLDGLNEKEQAFFLLYNSKNYVDSKFGISTYLNEEVCYMLVYVSEEEYSKYGKFLTRKERKEEIEDFGYDIIREKFDNTLGLFQFHDKSSYIKIKSSSLRIKNSKKLKEANTKLVKTFIGEHEEIVELIVKSTLDMFMTSNNEKTRTECAKILGNWFGIENRDTNSKIDLILKGINVGQTLQERLEKEELDDFEESN